jgi:hypothetical protein
VTQKRARERPQALAVKLSDSAAPATRCILAAAIAVTVERAAGCLKSVGYGAALDENLFPASVVFDQVAREDSGFRAGAESSEASRHDGGHDQSSVDLIAVRAARLV